MHWIRGWFGPIVGLNKHLSATEMEPRFLGSPAHGLVPIRTELSRLHAYVLYTTKLKAVSVTWRNMKAYALCLFHPTLMKVLSSFGVFNAGGTVPTDAVGLWNMCRCYTDIRFVTVLVMTGVELNLPRNCGKWTEDVAPFHMHMHAFINNSNNALTEYVALTHRGHVNQRLQHLRKTYASQQHTLFWNVKLGIQVEVHWRFGVT